MVQQPEAKGAMRSATLTAPAQGKHIPALSPQKVRAHDDESECFSTDRLQYVW